MVKHTQFADEGRSLEEYMESELSGIFRVKLVTKNIVRGSPGTQFMHMRVKESLIMTTASLGAYTKYQQ